MAFSLTLSSYKAFKNSNKCLRQMARGITDNSVVYFSNSQLMSVISSNNNVPIYEHFCVSSYTKQCSDLFNGQQLCLLTRTRRSRSLHGEWKVLMASVMASNFTMFAFTLAVFSLYITFIVNMIYLQILYQHEILQMQKW